MDFPESDDPWGSPVMHRGHAHETNNPKTNGTSRSASGSVHAPIRTTSNFTTTSAEASNGNGISNQDPNTPTTVSSGVWGSYDGNSNAAFASTADTTIGSEGFGGAAEDGDRSEPPRRSFGSGLIAGGPEETVVITLLPEKEGMFMFQHHNYQVSSPRRNSKVVRRYSDFVWLLDCLQKRYPFRQLPLLPPKRVGGQ